MKLTIEQLFQVEEINKLRVIAGKDGMDKVVYGVNVMDNPESFDWTVPGDLVLTTGFVFKDDPVFQRKIIQELAEHHCSGLAIKTRKYFGSMPPEIIKAGNEFNLPIIEIPKDLSLSQVSFTLYSIISNHSTKDLNKKSLSMHEKLMDITLAGGGLQEIVKEVSTLVKNPMLVLSNDWKLLAINEDKKNPFPINEVLHLEKDKPMFDESFKSDIPKDVSSFKKSIKRKIVYGDQVIFCRVMPIRAVEEILGYIVIWETMSSMTREDYSALEISATTMALMLIKQQELQETKEKIRNNFLEDLLMGNVKNYRDIRNMTGLYGIDEDDKYICILLRIEGFTDLPNDSNQEIFRKKRKLLNCKRTIISELQHIKNERNINLHYMERNRQIIFVYPVNARDNYKTSEEKSRIFADELYQRIMSLTIDMNLQVYIGGIPYSITEVNKSYLEVQDLVNLNKSLRNKHIVHYNDYLTHELFIHSTAKDKIEYYYDYAIKDLENFDLQNNSNLMDTMEIYFENQGNIERASKSLFIHRNTLNYRLKKVEEILNVNLKNHQDAFKLQLGFIIKSVLEIDE